MSTTVKRTKRQQAAHEKKMEQIATEIQKFLLDRGMWIDTRVYFNGKAFNSYPVYVDDKNVNYNNPEHLHVIESIDPEQSMTYYNRDTITMSFEGDFYDVVNGSYGWNTEEEFSKLVGKYGYYYELGNAWNLALYEN